MRTRHPELANAGDCLVILIDTQERLWPHMDEPKDLERHIGIVLEAAEILEIPILATEQYPEGLGPTIGSLADLLPRPPIAKKSFSCFEAPELVDAVAASGRRQLVLLGIEAHVCVLQSALDAIAWGYQVHVPEEAISPGRRHHDRRGVAPLRVDERVRPCLLPRSAEVA